MSSNPLELVYDTIWEQLEDNEVLCSLVKEGNRLKFSGIDTVDPIKHEISEEDLPELRLIVPSTDIHLNATSSSSRITKVFEIGVATGELLFTGSRAVLAVEWEVIKSMSNWQAILKLLTWNDKTFITNTQLLTTNIGTTDIDLVRGINGWTALMTIQVDMWFSSSELIP